MYRNYDAQNYSDEMPMKSEIFLKSLNKIFFEGTLGWVLKLSSNSLGPPGCEDLASVCSYKSKV